MAVFPDRIVLKNSTDSQSAIETAIQTGGTDEITQGELVLGLETSTVKLYTKTGDGSIVTFAPGVATARAIVSDIPPTIGINSVALAEGDLWFESDTGRYYVYYISASDGVATFDFASASTTNAFQLSQATVAATVTGGSGTGAAVDVATDGSGNITSVTIKASGFGYVAGEQVTLSEVFGTGVATIDVNTIGTSDWVQVSGGGGDGSGGGGGVTSIVAGTNIAISPASGLGDVTINGEISSIGDLDNVQEETGGPLKSTGFDVGQTSFTDPDPAATAGAVSTDLGDRAYKVPSTSFYGDGSALSGFLNTNARYDIVNLRIRSTNAIDTNNRVSLGGNKQTIISGAGFTIYTRDTGFGFYCDGSFQEIGTKPLMNANTYYEVTYVLDWGSAQRATLPAVSLWVDGAIAVNQVTPSVSYTELTGAGETDFRIAYSTVSQSNSGDKYWDDVRVATSDTVPWGTSDSTITNPASLMDTAYGGSTTTDGHVLTWVAANSQWQPAAPSGGRGDGGDFDTGTVGASFAFGVYGGGDFSTGTDDDPVELLGGEEGPDGGSF